jgi:Ca2+-binding EF-hand superfamily protein
LQLGVAERAKVHTEQIERQREEDRQREEEHQRKVLETANRQTYKVDFTYGDPDKESILEKLQVAAEKFDKNHPAAPSLEAFDAAFMMPGVFRENIKSIFGVRATPKEIGYLLELYDKDKSGRISTRDFLIKFFALGQEIRDSKKRATLIQQREVLKAAKAEEEMKLIHLVEKSDYQIDRNYTSEDYREAIRRMTIASEKYDKAHPSAPNLDGFTGGPLSPGAFRELMKRAFQIYLTPKEVAAILDKNRMETNSEMVDGKKFLIMFMKLGQEARARRRTAQLIEQRKFQKEQIQEQERKLRMALRRVELEVDGEYNDIDRQNALNKIIEAAALYDKNAPGCVSLDSFNLKFFTPGVFRETIKRTFNIILTPNELAAMIAEFNNGAGNVDTQKFLVSFIKMGQDEREKRKLIQLEKQRNMNAIREKVAEEKKKAADAKNDLKVSYKYSEKEKEEAFYKLAIAAKKFDKAHPAAMTLDGFEEKSLKPHVFREMLKRTFNFVASPAELGAIIHYFDQDNTGEVSSKKFLIHFIKLGIAERDKEHKESLRKLSEDAELRERQHIEKMAAQWAKAEMKVIFEFSEDEKKSAMEKLTVASSKFDPASPGPMGLTGFQAKVLSPTIFREMLKRCFNLLVTNGELAALIHEFEDKDQFAGKHMINCHDFLIKFNSLGFEKRNEFRLAQIEKQRQLDAAYEEEMRLKKIALDTKKDINIGAINFTEADFQSALEKIRILASNYDRSHPSAPSLKGFTGTDMKPNEFKDMLMRTFQMPLTIEELAALVAFFPADAPSTKTKDRSSSRSPSRSRSRSPSAAVGGARINNKEFLNYFNKIQRDEQSKRHFERIQRERDLKRKEKEKKKQLEDEQVNELITKLKYTSADENTCVEKLIEAAKEYAIDSAPYIDRLQGFKGPALPPDKFRELFYNIFAVRFTFPELGVLLSILDYSKLRVFDGPRFLNFFYKISRMEEKYMLGESEVPVTIETLREVGKRPSHETASLGPDVKSSTVKTLSSTGHISTSLDQTRLSTSQSLTSSTVKSSSVATTKSSKKEKRSADSSVFPMVDYNDIVPYDHRSHGSDSHAFNRSTLQQSWLLPSVASLDQNNISEDFSFYNEKFHNMATSKEQERLVTAGTKVRDHLRLLFHADKLNDQDAFTTFGSEDSLDGSSFVSEFEEQSAFRTPAQVIEAIGNLGKMRISVQTAPEPKADLSDRSLASRSDSKLRKMPKTKSSPFIIIAANQDSHVSRGRRGRDVTNDDDTITTTVTEQPSLDVTTAPKASSPLNKEKDAQSVDSTIGEVHATRGSMNHAEIGKPDPIKVSESEYLRSLFSSLSTITDPSSHEKKVPSYAKDPVSQLVRIQKHFHQTPMAAMASKQKESNRKYRVKKLPQGNLAPIETLKKLIDEKDEEKKNKTKKNEGGFFFPTLLSSDSAKLVTSTEDTTTVGNETTTSKDLGENHSVPNIGVVGGDATNTENYDLDFLKQLLLPTNTN